MRKAIRNALIYSLFYYANLVYNLILLYVNSISY